MENIFDYLTRMKKVKIDYLDSIANVMKRLQRDSECVVREIENAPEDEEHVEEMKELAGVMMSLLVTHGELYKYLKRIRHHPSWTFASKNIVDDLNKFFGADGWQRVIKDCKNLEHRYGLSD